MNLECMHVQFRGKFKTLMAFGGKIKATICKLHVTRMMCSMSNISMNRCLNCNKYIVNSSTNTFEKMLGIFLSHSYAALRKKVVI